MTQKPLKISLMGFWDEAEKVQLKVFESYLKEFEAMDNLFRTEWVYKHTMYFTDKYGYPLGAQVKMPSGTIEYYIRDMMERAA